MARSRIIISSMLHLVSEATRTPAEPKRIIYGPWANAFLKAIKATGELAEELRNAGYDPLHPPEEYPPEVFVNMLALVRRHLFPDLSPAEGYRRIGRMRLAVQIESNIAGKLWGKAFPLLGPDRVIHGISRFATSGTNFMKIESIKEGDKHWHVTFRNTAGFPGEVIAGSLHYALGLAGASSERKVVVSHFDAAREECDLDVTW